MLLGTAAAAAAGTIGGSLVLGGIRNMLGGAGHGAFAGTFDGLSGAQPVEVITEYQPAEDSPWAGRPDDLSVVATMGGGLIFHGAVEALQDYGVIAAH